MADRYFVMFLTLIFPNSSDRSTTFKSEFAESRCCTQSRQMLCYMPCICTLPTLWAQTRHDPSGFIPLRCTLPLRAKLHTETSSNVS